MLGFLVNRAGRWSIDGYLQARARTLAGRVAVRCYEDLAEFDSLPVGGCIFSAVDQLTPAGVDAAGALWRALAEAAPGRPLLNDPFKVLGRYDLLRRLKAEGVNRFQVTRAADARAHRRYPAFVREEHRHNGSLTGLLSSPDQVRRALSTLALRGYHTSDLLIVEFCDVRDSDGLVRKYSAFRVGGRIIPRSINAGRHWEVKSQSAVHDEELVRAERAYLEDHPHEPWLTRVFEIASVDYGRIDYGLFEGTPQVWEINTGPTISRGGSPRGPENPEWREAQEPNRRLFHGAMIDALATLAAAPVAITPMPVLVRETASPLTRSPTRNARFRAFDALHRLADRVAAFGWLRSQCRPLVKLLLPRFRDGKRPPRESVGT